MEQLVTQSGVHDANLPLVSSYATITFNQKKTPEPPQEALDLDYPGALNTDQDGVPSVHSAYEGSDSSNTSINTNGSVEGSRARREAATTDVGSPKLGEMVENCQPSILEASMHGEEILFFSNDHIHIKKSQIAGYGTFASIDLFKGDIILREGALMVANLDTLFQEFDKLDGTAKETALSLYANPNVKLGTPLIQAVWQTNCFALPGGNAGLFPIASRMNHACHPSQNIDFFYDTRDCYLVFVVKAETVKAGQELTICYGSNLIPIDLVCRYGFRCECGCCPGVGEDQINRMENW